MTCDLSWKTRSVDTLSRRGFMTVAAAAGAGALLPAPLRAASDYPTRQITIVSPAAAGGPSDFVARSSARYLQDVLGKPVVVENRTGAAGNIGAQFVARAEPDGYTLLTVLAPLAQNTAIYKAPGYDLQKDFRPLALMASTDLLIVARKNAPFNNLAELMKYTADGKSVSCGVQSPPQIEYLKRVTKINITIVPYRGSALTINDLLAGQIDIGLSPYGDAAQHIQAGNIKPLFCLGEKRARYLPDLETVAETFPGFGFWSWYGVVAPANVPAEIGDRLQSELVRIAKSAAYQKELAAVGLSPIDAPEQFGSVIAKEVAQWRKLVDELGLPKI